jgi:fructose/tagatose bisphosphate aldolase
VKKMLVTNKEVLTIASAEGYAVGAFNINNMEILQAEKMRLFGSSGKAI